MPGSWQQSVVLPDIVFGSKLSHVAPADKHVMQQGLASLSLVLPRMHIF